MSPSPSLLYHTYITPFLITAAAAAVAAPTDRCEFIGKMGACETWWIEGGSCEGRSDLKKSSILHSAPLPKSGLGYWKAASRQASILLISARSVGRASHVSFSNSSAHQSTSSALILRITESKSICKNGKRSGDRLFVFPMFREREKISLLAFAILSARGRISSPFSSPLGFQTTLFLLGLLFPSLRPLQYPYTVYRRRAVCMYRVVVVADMFYVLPHAAPPPTPPTCNNCVISASSAVVATLRSFFRKLPYRAVYCTPM